MLGVDGHPDAGLDVQALAFQVKVLAKGGQDLVGRCTRMLAGLAAFEQHHKFIATQPRHGV